MNKFGEPWKAIDGSRGTYINKDNGCSVAPNLSRKYATRAVACVNAMVGLDPVKVREAIEHLWSAHEHEEIWNGESLLKEAESFYDAIAAALAARLPEEGEGNA